MIDRKKFSEFYNNLEIGQIPEETVVSFYQKISECDYKNSIRNLLSISATSFYWSLPDGNFSFYAHDPLLSFTNNEFEKSIKDFNELHHKIYNNSGNEQYMNHPIFVGGLKFPSAVHDVIWNDFESSKWFIPKIIFLRTRDEYFLRFNFHINDNNAEFYLDEINRIIKTEKEESKIDSKTKNHLKNNFTDSDIHLWTKQVESALNKISNGEFSKIVLARFRDFEFAEQPDIFSQLKILEENFPNCYIFAFREGKSIFFGASPEKLFSVENEYIETDALAGSIPRGENSIEDKQFETELLQSKKNLAEHKSVVDFLLNRLTPVTEKILFDSNPSIKKFHNIQHLYAQIRAKLKAGTSIYSLLKRLHPTPAICGMPQHLALKNINLIENFERGMYAGVIGWFNLRNEGDFAVGIRSAILRDKHLRAFAGCGIVEGSESISEYNETELKLKSILSLFENEAISKS